MYDLKSMQQHEVKSLWHRNSKQLNEADPSFIPLKGALKKYINAVIAMALPLCVDNFLPSLSEDLLIFCSCIIFTLLIVCSYLKVQATKGHPSCPCRGMVWHSA